MQCIKEFEETIESSVAHLVATEFYQTSKMKMIVVAALALVAVVAAAPVQEEPIPILRSESVQSPEGGFQYSFETGNGIKESVTGELKEVVDEENKPHQVVVQRGSYSYVDNEGTPVSVEWYADESGFHATGDNISKAASRR